MTQEIKAAGNGRAGGAVCAWALENECAELTRCQGVFGFKFLNVLLKLPPTEAHRLCRRENSLLQNSPGLCSGADVWVRGSHLALLCFTWTLSPSPSPSPSPIPTPALRAAPKPKPELFLGLWLFCPFSLLSLKVISETFWECLGRQSCFHCLHKGQGRVWHFCERLVHAEPLSGTEEAGCVCCEKDNYSSAAGSSVPRIRAHIAQLRADTDI